MKKFVLSAIVVMLMSAGLVAGSTTTASAARYPGTIGTVTNASSQGAVKRFERPKLRVRVTAKSGNRSPRGRVFVTYVHRSGSPSYSYDRFYNGQPTVYSFPALRKPGKYIVTVNYRPKGSSVFVGSGSQARQFVKNRPRVRR